MISENDIHFVASMIPALQIAVLINLKVTCEYSFKRGAAVPIRVHTVVVSTQHMADMPLDVLRHEVMEHVIKYTIPPKYLDERTVYHINPCGEFITGGPMVTCEYSFKRGAAVPIRVHTVVVSTQHMADMPLDVLRHEVMEHVIKYTIPPKYLDERTVYHINPCGEFITGGSMACPEGKEDMLNVHMICHDVG